MTVEERQYYDSCGLTVNTFVNAEYRTQSQSTENFMIQDGLDFYQFEPEKRIKEVADAARKYNEQKRQKELENNVQNIKKLSLRK